MTRVIFVATAVGIGACLSLQPPVNTVMARRLGSPLLAASISIGISLIVVLLVWLIGAGGAGDLAAVRALPWWVVIGGVVGVVFVASGVVVAPRLGVASFFVFVIAGQLVGSLLVDRLGFFGLVTRPVTVVRLVGLGLVIAGAALVQYRHG